MITCPFDGTDQMFEFCLQKRRSAKLQQKRNKPVTLVQCLTCNVTKVEAELKIAKDTLICCICGKEELKTSNTQKMCWDCKLEKVKKRGISPKRLKKMLEHHEKVLNGKHCIKCGKKLPFLAIRGKWCSDCKKEIKQ